MTGIISRGERLYFRRYAMLFLTFIPSTGKVEQSGLIGRNLISLGICWIIEIQCVGLLESYTKSNRGSQTTCYTYFYDVFVICLKFKAECDCLCQKYSNLIFNSILFSKSIVFEWYFRWYRVHSPFLIWKSSNFD